MIPVLAVVALSIIGVTGDYFIKLAGNKPAIQMQWFLLGAAIYSLSSIGWLFAMRHIKLTTLGAIYATTSALALVAVGVLFFKEKLTLTEIIGIVLALVSVWLLTRFA